jgi:hypothetical protein
VGEMNKGDEVDYTTMRRYRNTWFNRFMFKFRSRKLNKKLRELEALNNHDKRIKKYLAKQDDFCSGKGKEDE